MSERLQMKYLRAAVIATWNLAESSSGISIVDPPLAKDSL
jgi:hypothetical protein